MLYESLKKTADVWVVAPLDEKSTTGHSLTLHKPLRMVQIGKRFFGVSGSPADCVYLGICEVMKTVPDLVISGINRGANLGQDIYYSGTVSAAREACIIGIPSIAISLAVDFKKRHAELKINYKSAVKVLLQLLPQFLKNFNLPEQTLLNLNVPDMPYNKIKGIKLTRQGQRFYSGSILRRKDHRGKDYYWVGGQYKGFRKDVETDCYVVDKGYAALTPLHLDGTNHAYLSLLKRKFHDLELKK